MHGIAAIPLDRVVQHNGAMHRPNLPDAEVTVMEARGRRSEPFLVLQAELLETATDLMVEILEEEPANTVECEIQDDASLEPGDADSNPAAEEIIELSSADLQEVKPSVGLRVPRSAARSIGEPTRVLRAADLEAMARNHPGLMPDETVLIYCRAGDPLPPYARHARELPRFAEGRATRQGPRAAVVGTGRLPSFSIPDDPVAVEASRRQILRPVPGRLPSVPPRPVPQARSRIPAGALPKFILDEPVGLRRAGASKPAQTRCWMCDRKFAHTPGAADVPCPGLARRWG